MSLLSKCTRLPRIVPMFNQTQFKRGFYLTPIASCSDDIKKDKDIKSLLSEIYDDFDDKENIRRSAKSEHRSAGTNHRSSGTEHVSAGSNEETEDKTKRTDLEDLLSQMYQEDDQVGSSLEGYTAYRDEDATVIYDVDEERLILKEAYASGKELVLEKEKRHTFKDKYEDISKSRGSRGVFDLEELLAVFRGEKMKNIAVIKVPENRFYSDYVVIGTGSSARHLHVTSQIIKKLYKKKYIPKKDPVPPIEGEKDKGASGWVAMDLGNIVIHLFIREERKKYDLESLWTVGSKFDNKSQSAPDTLQQLMSSHLADFEPLDSIDAGLEPRDDQNLHQHIKKYVPVYE